MNEYVKDFIIGSSWPVFILYFYGVSKFPDNIKNYSYTKYTFIAPLILGLFNVMGHIMANAFGLSRTQRFVLTGIVSAICVASFITLFKMYNFSTQDEWITQYITLLIIYIFVFAIIVNNLDYAASQ